MGIFLGAKCCIWCLKENGDSFLLFFCIYWSTLIKVLPCSNIWCPYLFGIRKYPWYLRMLTSDKHQLMQGLRRVWTAYLNGQGLVVNAGQWDKVPELFWVLWMVSWLQGLRYQCSVVLLMEVGIHPCPWPQDWLCLKNVSQFAAVRSCNSHWATLSKCSRRTDWLQV